MSEEQKHQKKERRDFAFGISRSEFFTSIAVGIGSGLATAAKTVRDLFKDDARDATTFQRHFHGEKKLPNDAQGPRFMGRQERLDSIDLQTMLANGQTKADYQTAISQEKRKIAKEFDQIALERRGIRKNLILGSIDKFKLLSPDSKYELYFTGAVGAVVGAALTLGFFNGVATRDKIERIEDAVAPDNSQSR